MQLYFISLKNQSQVMTLIFAKSQQIHLFQIDIIPF